MTPGRGAAGALFLAVAGLMVAMPGMAGCGWGGQTTVTVERTVTNTGDTGGSSQEEKDRYISEIKDLTTQANIMESDYRALIAEYNQGQARAEDLSAKAEQNWRAYEDLGKHITEMKTPREFQTAHQLLISGFSKWRAAFESYRNGFRDANNDSLAQANDLDSQASTEVNQAINQITQEQ